ncbi:MAG: tRNA (uridine(34)/cytosine(34)/5-carboxymethylaminomethyluridine(34)-2'-O)-methyltransferase TrmL [Andreesenia angusta]|nr:tRNA (uridine(34)/cytosine(34)/5-carboxymethylaminomethyluridine(34)-2'-O)-methyltransferase TrmL [Andreesenia angusta]
MFNIVLYQPEIPQNTGNIARTCVVTGTRLHIIKPMGFSIDSKHVKRSGLDYWPLLNLNIYENLDEFFEKTKGKRYIFATTKGSKDYSDFEYNDDDYIVFGKETAGLPDIIHQRYKDYCMRIPMLNIEEARSLNLSNTVAIVLYEALRQNDFLGLV